MSPRKLTAVALGSLLPVWAYTLGVAGGPSVALASSACVLLVVGSLYAMFGPHGETAHGTTDAGGR